ncbi:MAG: hypothetical protein RMK91_04050 [Pseudanabaenaceae cyanobacterium SKYGB_i_bin29]|nr:hypothetical protein [Pseudanabaenaceae cyanobacterium SKYG29]MDW8421016.1 hypothetical protein [Pseudanabaenaceae cyanobacterium SKYGB_i_bin29]
MADKQLLRRDYTFIFVREAASWQNNHPNFLAWREAQTAIIELAKQCSKYDRSGIDIYFATTPPQRKTEGSPADLAKVFQLKEPIAANDLLSSFRSARLPRRQMALDNHFADIEPGKKETIVVFLDHLPEQQTEIVQALVEATKKIDGEREAYRLGVSFVLIGDNEEAKTFLNFLDDELGVAGAAHDIVDAKGWRAMKQSSIEKFLLDALLD